MSHVVGGERAPVGDLDRVGGRVGGPTSEFADAHVIALAGEVDPGMVVAFHRRVDRALDAGAARVVLDLSAVTVLGGPTMGVLCGALRGLAHRGTTIAVAGGPRHVKRVLERCAIDRLEHYATGEAALLAALLLPSDPRAVHDRSFDRGSTGAPLLAFSQ